MKLTVNRALALSKAIYARLGDLKALRSEVSTTETYFGSKESKKEPNYSVKDVDAKIVRLQKMIFEIDSRIKESNAVVEIDVDVDENLIFESL